MRFISSIAAIAAVVQASTPPGLLPQSSNDLAVAFGSVAAVNGVNLPRNATLTTPLLGTTSQLYGTYTLMMVDYDIPGGSRLLHWMQPGLVSQPTTTTLAGQTVHQLLNNSAPYATYNPPNPPNRAPVTHRYVQILLNTTNAANASAVLAQLASNRSAWDPVAAVNRAGVTVVAGNWFNVTNANATANATATTPAQVTSTSGANGFGASAGGLIGAVAFAACFLTREMFQISVDLHDRPLPHTSTSDTLIHRSGTTNPNRESSTLYMCEHCAHILPTCSISYKRIIICAWTLGGDFVDGEEKVFPSNAGKVQSRSPTFQTMNSLWSSGQNDPAPPKDNADVADTGLADVGLPSPTQQPVGPAGRPQLSRNQPAPPPPHQPPPPPAPQQIGNPTDSLSLMQLRRIVTEFPRVEPIAYTFEYADTAPFEEEIDEWFSYSDAEGNRLRHARHTFERRWKKAAKTSWFNSDITARQRFLEKEIASLSSSSLQRRCKSLQTILHVVLGVWHDSAELPIEERDTPKKRSHATSSQVKAIIEGVSLLNDCDGISRIFDVMKRAFERLWGEEFRDGPVVEEEVMTMQDELDNVTTILYVAIEAARSNPIRLQLVQDGLLSVRPGLADYLITLVARLRWDDTSELPQTRIFLLFWKTILLTFGDTSELNNIKTATRERDIIEGQPDDLITASPLDYHLFRQEITSKYPAYVPPAPLIPLELESTSILPPLPNHPTRNNGANGIIPGPASSNSGGASILHQPVHIATPAPSPPPSPAVGGKAGKKQNYQTNQNFPFMYPPLDSTSNSAGGKGLAGLQEALVGRKWEGSEIPASILEAGKLFAARTRMTRATRQLWDERERYLKFERGWVGKSNTDNDDIVDIDLDSILAESLEINKLDFDVPPVDYGPRGNDKNAMERLDRVEAFYRGSIPHLQSLVIVLLKAVLANVTALITQPMYPSAQGAVSANTAGDQNGRNLPTGAGRTTDRRAGIDPTNPPPPPPFDVADLAIEDLEALRSREITAKSVSGILLMLLKWFKVSHVLKFEYLTQLLLDSNYLPLVLKLFAHSEIDKVVDCNAERLDLSFFYFCNINSRKAAEAAEVAAKVHDSEDEDDAVPPPIKMRREPIESDSKADEQATLAMDDAQNMATDGIPELDELGNVVEETPLEPKTDYSWRNFFSSINCLRIMQKICKNKAHRNLLLVQYKSSNILKKALKIPQHELRLYTLKLFKNQVPYCGRKWRQGNMRVITSVYLHCRPELRDDWLAGSDVDAEVEEALPLEQALRALTHWHNVKRYPEQMGADVRLLEEEQDFFVRELEKMDIEMEEDYDDNESQWDGSVSHYVMN